MDNGLFEHVKKRLKRKQKHPSIVKSLVRSGYEEAHVKKVIAVLNTTEKTLEKKEDDEQKLIRKFMAKEVLDKIAFGFGSQQFTNILFSQTGASYFLIGLVNGLNVVIGLFMSLVLREYLRMRDVSRNLIISSGFIFGLLFFLLALSRYYGSPLLFILCFLLTGVGVVFLGDIYVKEYAESLKKERIGYALSQMTRFGLIIITISLVVSAYLMDYFPTDGKTIMLFGKEVTVYGYLLSFFITMVTFIASSLVLHSLKREGKAAEAKEGIGVLLSEQVSKAMKYLKLFAENKTILILLVASTLTGFVQTLGSTYYGIFIYKTFAMQAFGGFLNVAMIFIVALVSAMLAPTIARQLSKKYGNVPMLVFGTLLVAILPLTYYARPTLPNIAAATVCGIIGSAIVGLATGLLISNRLPEAEREAYYSSYSILVTVPYLLLFPAGAYLADLYLLEKMFLTLGLLQAVIVMPLYFALLFIEGKRVL
ncbi:MFS transporter [Candidatus Woesearchaeota archaeon]|nr:MFS transporter [Candidatus Woesearchaeota archaeon]